MKKISRLWIVVWVLGILFPMAFLGRVWPAFGEVFTAAFSSNWTHVLMHSLLYAVLGFMLGSMSKSQSWRTSFRVIGIIVFVGLIHESIQILSAGVWPGWQAELQDLTVDTLGGAAGMGLSALFAKITNKANPAIENRTDR